MSKSRESRVGRRAAAGRTGRRLTGKVILLILACCLTASGLTWAGWRRLSPHQPSGTSAVSPPAAPVTAPPSPQNLSPASPAKEYIYAGGRLVATEEPSLLTQTISFDQPPDKTYGDTPFALSATASSSLPVSFSITSGPATVSGSTLTITGAGTVSVKADQAGNSGYQAAPSVTRTFTVAKATSSLTWNDPAAVTYGTALGATQLNATASVSGSFTYTPAAGTVPHAGTQSLHVAFTPSDTANYNGSAKDVSLTVNKAVLTITAQNKTRAYGESNPALTYTLNGFVNGDTQAGATSGQPALSTSATTNSPAGTYAINAAAGTLTSADYSFSLVNGTLTVTKAGQTISFSALGNKTFGDADFTVSATASSGLSVSFAAGGQCTVSGGTIHITGAGSCTITASQAGDSNYNAASSVERSFTIAKAASTTTVTAANATYDGNAHGGTAVATGVGGLNQSLTVSYSGRNGTSYGPSATAPTNAGDYTASASYAGSANYNSSNGSQNFSIAKAASTTTVTAANATYDGQPHGGSAAATGAGGLNQSLTVSYSGRNGTSYGPSATAPTNAGDYTASASYGGGANHNGSSGSQNFSIAKATATLTLSDLTGHTYNGSAQTATVTTIPPGLSGVTITYNGSTTAPTNAGSYAVVASLTNVNYTASPVSGTMVVAKATPTITWNNPANIGSGTALSATQLNATASVAGTFSYNPAAGTVLNVGNNQTLSVTFTPTNTTNYNTATASVQINVIGCPTSAASTFTSSSPIIPGTSGTLSWNVPYASAVTIGGISGTFGATGSTTIAPASSTTYTLTATGASVCSTMTKQTQVLVMACPTNTNTTFSANHQVVASGGNVLLSWASQYAASLRIFNAGCAHCDDIFVGASNSGSVTVQPTATTTYGLEVDGTLGCPAVVKNVTVTVPGNAATCAPSATFGGTPVGGRCGGGEITLSWSVPNATSVTIVGASGASYGTYQSASGSVVVSEGMETGFTLTAFGVGSGSCAVIQLQAPDPCAE